ncbi:MAG TPA: ABC transporter substrate-binding protein [Negativicutes bacterium]
MLALFIIMLLGGCAAVSPRQQPVTGEGAGFRDATDHIVKLTQKPQRIVSLALGTDEILLGLISVERIAALTYLADDGGISNVAEQAKQVSVKIRANAETIISLQPDLVVTADLHPAELIQTIRDAGIPVYVYKAPSTIEEIKKVIGEVAQVLGEEARGGQLLDEMDAQLEQVAAKVRQIPAEKRLCVLRFSLLGGGGGTGTLFDDICHYAGVKNAANAVGLTRHVILAKEQIVAINPDIFFVPSWDYTGKTDPEQYKADIQADPALQTVTAIRQKKLIIVPDRHLVCSSQYIVYGVRDIAAAAYPQYVEWQ